MRVDLEGWPDLHEFVPRVEGGEEHEEHEMEIERGKIQTHTHTHTLDTNRFAHDGPIHQPNRITKGETVR